MLPQKYNIQNLFLQITHLVSGRQVNRQISTSKYLATYIHTYTLKKSNLQSTIYLADKNKHTECIILKYNRHYPGYGQTSLTYTITTQHTSTHPYPYTILTSKCQSIQSQTNSQAAAKGVKIVINHSFYFSHSYASITAQPIITNKQKPSSPTKKEVSKCLHI